MQQLFYKRAADFDIGVLSIGGLTGSPSAAQTACQAFWCWHLAIQFPCEDTYAAIGA